MIHSKKETHRLWHIKNRSTQIQKMKEWRLKNPKRVKEYRKEHHHKNQDRINQHKKEYRRLHPEKAREYRQRSEVKQRNRERYLNPEVKRKKNEYARIRSLDPIVKAKKKEYGKIHSQLPHVKARTNLLARLRRKNNPKSNRRASYELQDAMNNVRIRDKNICQWQGCNLTFRQVPIHVHHIFPRNEYPDLELIEQYMICYCANHHGLFHRMRGDKYSEMIPARYQERGLMSLDEVEIS